MAANFRHSPLLIVGGNDPEVIELNKQAHAALACEKLLRIVPGASHLFEESGTLEMAIDFARAWFEHYLDQPELGMLHMQPDVLPAQPKRIADVLRAGAEPLPALDDRIWSDPAGGCAARTGRCYLIQADEGYVF